MKAIGFDTFGGPEVLALRDVPEPHAGTGEIRVRVHAAGVNPVDWKVRRGWLEQMFHTEFPAIAGIEIAGTVDEVGAGVTAVVSGDEVLGWAEGGGYAEFATAVRYVRKPAALSWPVAAALPVAGSTAQRGLNELGVRTGQTVVINGAAGGVGGLAVQLAVARGAKVIGTASATNQDYIRSLGATPVVYGEGLVERVRAAAPGAIDAAFDLAGKGGLPALIELTGSSERVLTIADMDAQKYNVRFSSGGDAAPAIAALEEVVRLVSDGKMQVAIERTFPLAAAAEAQQVSESGHARGKLILEIA